MFLSFQLFANDSQKSIHDNKKIGIYYLSDSLGIGENDELTNFSLNLKVALMERHPKASFTVVELADKLPYEIDESLNSNPDYAITIGRQALLKVLASRSNTPIYSLKAPRITLDRMRKIYADLGIQVSGIYREQPLHKQLALADAIQPLNKNIYLLFGRMSRYYLDDYKKQVPRLGHKLFYQVLKNQDSPVSYFYKMNPQSGFLLLFDNPQQFTRQKIGLLLPISFKLNIPMIGNRLLHGHLGSLASIYSNENELIKKTSDAYSQYFENDRFESPLYLDDFSVFVNQQIAQNFALDNLNEKQLEIEIKTKLNQRIELTKAN